MSKRKISIEETDKYLSICRKILEQYRAALKEYEETKNRLEKIKTTINIENMCNKDRIEMLRQAVKEYEEIKETPYVSMNHELFERVENAKEFIEMCERYNNLVKKTEDLELSLKRMYEERVKQCMKIFEEIQKLEQKLESTKIMLVEKLEELLRR